MDPDCVRDMVLRLARPDHPTGPGWHHVWSILEVVAHWLDWLHLSQTCHFARAVLSEFGFGQRLYHACTFLYEAERVRPAALLHKKFFAALYLAAPPPVLEWYARGMPRAALETTLVRDMVDPDQRARLMALTVADGPEPAPAPPSALALKLSHHFPCPFHDCPAAFHQQEELHEHLLTLHHLTF